MSRCLRARMSRALFVVLSFASLLAITSAPLFAAGHARPSSPASAPSRPANTRNWVSVHIFDTIWPFQEEASFPEVLGSIETIMQTFNNRSFWRTVEGYVGIHPPFGNRTDMGHYLMWVHFSDDFVAKHSDQIQSSVDPLMYMFPDQRKTDIFTAWGGSVNLAAFFKQGVSGLGVPVADPTTGKLGGNFENFTNDIVPLGEADYSGGWYMTDEQAEAILTAYHSYPGLTKGYSFMAPIAVKPNAPYEHKGAELVNGYNCGDFVFYALTTAGVVARDTVEALKVQFWYPERFLSNALPLKGLGSQIVNWLNANPGQTSPPTMTVIGMAWPQLLFGSRGIEFFDKKAIKDQIADNWYKLNYARVWDQTSVISWFQSHADFTGKGIVTELQPIVQAGTIITAPDRTVAPTPKNKWTFSSSRKSLVASGDTFQRRKMKDANLWGEIGDAFKQLWTLLKFRHQHPEHDPGTVAANPQ